jgi:AraC-like DNA-binding protein
VEEIKRNHIADLEVQHKYGVRFIQYWINEDAGLVFCLMEAPDKESCAAVHREAHGAMPCNIIELKGGDYLAFMDSESKANEVDIVEHPDGTFDAGYRVIMAADFISIANDNSWQGDVDPILKMFDGRLVNMPGSRKTVVFITTYQAIECALTILKRVQTLPGRIEVRIGISAGEPVTQQSEIFGEAIALANLLCDIARNGQLLISSLAKELTDENKRRSYTQEESLKMLDTDEEQFLDLLMRTINKLLPGSALHIDSLGQHLGMSRSRLYRKITDLTGFSANSLIQELRMQKALRLIRSKYGNVTQVAMETGFNNPSYFAKNFQKRFGILPLKAAKLLS